MITVSEVKTKKQQREFLRFPLNLYRDNPCFVPPLYVDEKKIFRADYVYYDTCEVVYYNAYRDGKMVGRISGILQKTSNELRGERRVRFTRFDAIDDLDVAKALFGAVEAWAKEKGMDTVCGPLGFSDLEREGLLIEGFDKLSTFEEQYNAPYYAALIEACGYGKEVDWTESEIRAGDEATCRKLDELATYLLDRYHLHFGEAKNTREFLRRYADGLFDLLDRSYAPLYGTVPFTDGMKKLLIDNFKLIINLRYVAVVLDENEKVVCFGLCLPSLAKAMRTANGHLTPLTLWRTLRAIKKPEIIDFALIGVDPAYANRGISSVISAKVSGMFRDNPQLDHAETNLNLEDNYAIQNQWKRFSEVKHKRRRSYVKTLGEEESSV